MTTKIKSILISIFFVFVLIVGLIAVTNRGKGKAIKDNVKDYGKNAKNAANNIADVVNNVANAVINNVSKGLKGAGDALNSVSDFFESPYFFEKDYVQTIFSALLYVSHIVALFIYHGRKEEHRGFAFQEIKEKFNVGVILLPILVSIIIEALIIFGVGSIAYFTRKNKWFETIKKIFKSRFYYRNSWYVTVLKLVVFFVTYLVVFYFALAGFIWTFFTCCADDVPDCLKTSSKYV